MRNVIGIAGGVGPYAGLDLNAKIFDLIPARVDQDYPEVFLLSRSFYIGDRTAFLEGKNDINPAYEIYKSIQMLEKIGANLIAVPCNTAHSPLIFDKIKSLISKDNLNVKLFHIVKETHNFIEKTYPNFSKIALLGTLGTYKSRLYQDIFAKFNKFELIEPDELGKQNIHDAIYNESFGIKSHSNPVSIEAREMLEQEITKLTNQNAQAIILGCTEIPLAIKEEKLNNAVLIDPTKALANALVNALG